jgi:hypothetical protein
MAATRDAAAAMDVAAADAVGVVATSEMGRRRARIGWAIGQTMTDRTTTDQAMMDQAMTGQTMTGRMMTGQVVLTRRH